MARPENESPNDFARIVAIYIKRAMGEEGLSGRGLARVIDKSEKYVRLRLDFSFQFELNDIERFCEHIEISPEDFIADVERSAPMADVVPLRKSDAIETTREAEAASDQPDYEERQERESEDT